MGRHDLHTVFIEDILDIGMECGQRFGTGMRCAVDCLTDQAVFGVIVGEGVLENPRRRISQHSGGTVGGLDPGRSG